MPRFETDEEGWRRSLTEHGITLPALSIPSGLFLSDGALRPNQPLLAT
jgi:hypothetical protein